MTDFNTSKKGKQSGENDPDQSGKTPDKGTESKVRRNFYIDRDIDKQLRLLKVEFDAKDETFEVPELQSGGGSVSYSAIVEQALREYLDKHTDT